MDRRVLGDALLEPREQSNKHGKHGLAWMKMGVKTKGVKIKKSEDQKGTKINGRQRAFVKASRTGGNDAVDKQIHFICIAALGPLPYVSYVLLSFYVGQRNLSKLHCIHRLT